MHLVQILLPLVDVRRQPLAHALFAEVRRELTERFGGLTTYTRSPARGLWKEEQGAVVQDDIVIYEVMVDALDPGWWRRYRAQLSDRFRQEALVIRAHEIQRF